jgi:hypothetical protein
LLKIPLARPLPTVSAALIGAGLLLVQLPILSLARPGIPGLADLNAFVQGRVSPGKESRYVDPDDLTTYFHRHELVWPDGELHPPTDLAILPADAGPAGQPPLTMRQPYQTIRLKHYILSIATDRAQALQPCLR